MCGAWKDMSNSRSTTQRGLASRIGACTTLWRKPGASRLAQVDPIEQPRHVRSAVEHDNGHDGRSQKRVGFHVPRNASLSRM